MDFEGIAGLRRRSDERYYMDIDGISDADFMAFFERADSGNNGRSISSVGEAGREIECPEAERLSGIIKSLEEEISAKKSKDGDHCALVDNAYSSEADHSAPHRDLLECPEIDDRPYSSADRAYHKENHGEGHGFNVMDSVEEMNMGLNYQYPFVDEDSIPIYGGAVEVDNYYGYFPGGMTAAEGYYGDGGEFFDESLWENTGS